MEPENKRPGNFFAGCLYMDFPSASGGRGESFPLYFEELDDEGMPAGWNIRKSGDNAESAVVSSFRDEKGEVVMKIEIPTQASVLLDPVRSFDIDPAHDYMAVVQIKVEDMRHEGNWYNDGRGIRVWLQGRTAPRSAHAWLAVHGRGSTDGWVTGILTFPTDDEERRQMFDRVNLFLRCQGMTGTVYFRNPMIIRKDSKKPVQREFRLSDGTVLFSPLELTKAGLNVEQLDYNIFGSLPESFMSKWRVKEKDLEILLVGDSLTGNTDGSGNNPYAAHSPPGFNHLHWGYLLWSSICDNKPVADRFDSVREGTGVFTAVGEWVSNSAGKFNRPADSGEFSRGTDTTWMSNSLDAKVSLRFDADSYEKLNIVEGHHTDGAACVIRIKEGDRKLLVSTDKTTYQEANNFSFSQAQRSDGPVSQTGVALHQRHRRIWLKAADEGVSGVLNVSFERDPSDNAPDRYMYFWGTERWSGNSVFVTNIGRGGRSISLLNVNVTDIYDRNPDLVIVLLPLNNEYRTDYAALEEQYRAYFFGNPEKPDSHLHARSLRANSGNYHDFAAVAAVPTGRSAYWEGDNAKDHNGPNDMLPYLKFRKIFDFVSSTNEFENFKVINLQEHMIAEAKNRGLTIQESMEEGIFTTDGVHLSNLGSRLYAKYLTALFK